MIIGEFAKKSSVEYCLELNSVIKSAEYNYYTKHMTSFPLPTQLATIPFLTAGWNLLKERFNSVLKLVGLMVVLEFIPQLIVSGIEPKGEEGILTLLLQFWIMFVSIGFLKMSIDLARGKEPALDVIWSMKDRYLPYLGGVILLSLRIMLGLFLFIIPGIIWAIQFQFVPHLIADKKMSIGDAFKTSSKMTEGKKTSLFFFVLFTSLFAMLGLVLFFFGVILTATIAGLAHILLYLYLLKESDLE